MADVVHFLAEFVLILTDVAFNFAEAVSCLAEEVQILAEVVYFLAEFVLIFADVASPLLRK